MLGVANFATIGFKIEVTPFWLYRYHFSLTKMIIKQDGTYSFCYISPNLTYFS